MTIQLFVDNKEIPVQKIQFSDGASSVKLDLPENFSPKRYISISVDPKTPVDNYIWEILSVGSAIAQQLSEEGEDIPFTLSLPYLPYGRADRVFENGNPNCVQTFLALFCDIFDEIFLTDPHSDYYKNFSNYCNFSVTTQVQCFKATGVPVQPGDVLVSPDKGAAEKTLFVKNFLESTKGIKTSIIQCSKTRELATGKIKTMVIPDDFEYRDKVFYIVDDICDGGGTFLALAEKMKAKGAKEVNLYVTHGIFSKQLEPFYGLIDKIYCYQTVSKYVNKEDILNFNKLNKQIYLQGDTK